jgi:hypothetical protein
MNRSVAGARERLRIDTGRAFRSQASGVASAGLVNESRHNRRQTWSAKDAQMHMNELTALKSDYLDTNSPRLRPSAAISPVYALALETPRSAMSGSIPPQRTASLNDPNSGRVEDYNSPLQGEVTHAQKLLERAAADFLRHPWLDGPLNYAPQDYSHPAGTAGDKVFRAPELRDRVKEIAHSAVLVDRGLRALSEGRAKLGGVAQLSLEREVERLWRESGDVVRGLTEILLSISEHGVPGPSWKPQQPQQQHEASTPVEARFATGVPLRRRGFTTTGDTAHLAHLRLGHNGEYLSDDVASDPGLVSRYANGRLTTGEGSSTMLRQLSDDRPARASTQRASGSTGGSVYGGDGGGRRWL